MEVSVQNPEYSGEKNVDSQGRIYMGEEYKDKKVRVIVEEILPDEVEE